jgi:hypothetical protein
VPPPEDRGNIIDKISAKNQTRKAERKKRKLYQRQLKHDAKVQLRRRSSAVSFDAKLIDEKGEGLGKVESVGSGSTGSTLVPDAFSGRSERVRSNAMEYDEYSSASSDSDDEDQLAKASKLEKAIAKADAKTARINTKADEKLNGKRELSAEKRDKVEQDRDDDLAKVQRELDRVKEELGEKREKRLEKRRVKNGKRVEKVGKRMQRLEWVIVVNAEAKEDEK